MKLTTKFLVAAAASVAAAGAASAADLPSRKAPPAFVQVAPLFTWTGFYVGVNAGGAFADSSNRNLRPTGNFLNPAAFPAANLPAISGNGNGDGDDARFTGGAQVGYNYQIGAIVLGAEADIQYLSGKNRGGFVSTLPVNIALPGPNTFTLANSRSNNYFGTVRARVGYAFDRLMVYATGGLAYGGNRNNGSATFRDGTGAVLANFVSNGGGDKVGYAVGGGLEYAFTNNFTVKGEYLYVDLNRKNRTYTSAAFPGFAFTGSNGDRFHVVRLGVNYKF